MGTTVFGRLLDHIAKVRARAIERAAIKDEIERFSFVTEDVSQVKPGYMEPLRQMCFDRYGPRDIDVEAIIKKTQGSLRDIIQNYPCYVGKKMEIRIKGRGFKIRDTDIER
ncbi:hypothetical protein CASFOL_031086 [Castilleja foliolosa]|uniref:Uncharacterized protein n=1 Tax=Castilleja foliolosa TaxID=1961234 RepID=A0ABD3C3S8_9LAMI